MPSTLTTNLRFRTVKNFEDSLVQKNNQFYIFFGQPLKWNEQDLPPTPVNSQVEINNVWSSIIFLKRIYQKDIALAFRKILWSETRLTPYDYYTDLEDLNNRDYFVVNRFNQVYKCISNANNTISTIEPTGTSISIFETSDGYRWKYMFTIPDFFMRKFATDEYLPIVSDENVKSAAVPGTVDFVEIQSSGSGYEPDTEIPIFISGDGNQNSSAEIEITSVNLDGSIEDFVIQEQGSNYQFDTSTTRVPVQIRQRFEAGTVTGVISEDFESAYGIATINAPRGEIVDLQIIKAGKNYSPNARAKIVQSSAYSYAVTNSEGSLINTKTVFSGENFRRAEGILVENSNPTQPALIHTIVSPSFGHGGNSSQELNVRTIIFNTFSIFQENDNFTTENDFRTVGLIENPISAQTNKIASENTLDATYHLVIAENNADQYSPDDTLIGTQSESRGFVIDSLNQNTIRYIRENQSTNFQVGEQVIPSTIGSTISTITSIKEPDVVPYSGEILLIDNREKTERSTNQYESTTFIINF